MFALPAGPTIPVEPQEPPIPKWNGKVAVFNV